MENLNEDAAIAASEEAIEDAKRTFGDEHLKVAECLENCAQLLKAAKQRLLDAANMEARAQLIRRHNFEKKVVAHQAEENPINATGTQQSPEPTSADKTRICPYCGAAIEREAILCRHCNAGDMQSVKVISEIFPSAPNERICPFCAGKLARESLVCWFCNAKLPPLATSPINGGNKINKKYMQPMQAALLSGFTLNGIAQVRLGQGKKGLVMILVSVVLGTLTMGISILITAPLAAYDAFMIADKLQKGKSIGTWEFF